ncbi:hypothetical protein GCM10023224_01340 [Streptomonospora halophila]|uniref:Uncharacterized protein n=1 Tax=Streptomonospora halophila TaxID=427369 RepID=A0ABP9GB30_9ACTN
MQVASVQPVPAGERSRMAGRARGHGLLAEAARAVGADRAAPTARRGHSGRFAAVGHGAEADPGEPEPAQAASGAPSTASRVRVRVRVAPASRAGPFAPFNGARNGRASR